MGKLSGITVDDLSVFLPGPMMTMMMADQGAEIWKVETASGDPARDQAPFEAGNRSGSATSIAAKRASSSILKARQARPGYGQ